MKIFCGIDIGSCTVKIVLIDENGNMIGHRIAHSGNQYYRNHESGKCEKISMKTSSFG